MGALGVPGTHAALDASVAAMGASKIGEKTWLEGVPGGHWSPGGPWAVPRVHLEVLRRPGGGP